MNENNEIEKFDEIKWLNDYAETDHSINLIEIQKVLSFCLMWNLFERIVCDKNANAKKIDQFVEDNYSEKIFTSADYEQFLSYFKNRYVSGNDMNSAFYSLNFRRGDKKELVEKVLKQEDSSGKLTIKALLLIVLRLRNNLFHGIKNTYELKLQDENFNIANQIIAKYLEMLKKRNNVNLSVVGK